MAAIKMVQIQLHEQASKSYGLGLWDKQTLIAEGAVSNAFEKPLPANTDPRNLKGPAMYWVKSNLPDVEHPQLVIKYEGDGWAYATCIKDKEGEPVLSDDNTYEIHDVKLKSQFKIPNVKDKDGNDIVLQKGFMTTKAYAV